ncbi:MAG: LysR family transcriptional regulator [Planctomycetes bacterium]|nr:LysR family transcriptional regulator [Planctomycetota bacterium]
MRQAPLDLGHLRYFEAVVRLGSVTAAARALGVTQPTVSVQVRALERALGVPLLVRGGRRLVPTEAGRAAAEVAGEIFRLEADLNDAVHGRLPGRPRRLRVGLLDGIPKALAARLVEPAFDAGPAVRVEVREGPMPVLLADLLGHDLDVVLTDVPASEPPPTRTTSTLLVECGVSFLAPPRLARAARGFPRSLDGLPVLLPTARAALRRALDAWFAAERLRPVVVGEMDDGALLAAVAAHGRGVFVVPSVVVGDARREHGAVVVGATDAVRERVFAVTAGRTRDPSLAALLAAR